MRSEDFNEILEKTTPFLFQYFYNRLKNKSFRGTRKDIANEMIQLTSIQAYQNSLKENLLKHTIEELLKKKARNVFTDFFNTAKKSPTYVDQIFAVQAIAPNPDPYQLLVLSEEVQRARAVMSESDWNLFTQIADHIPHQAIATQRNMTVNALDVHIHRLRQKIQARLNRV